MVVVIVGSATNAGAVRELNEDAVFVGERLYVVADGMGGHAAGDVASGLAVSLLAPLDHPALDESALVDGVGRVNAAILDHAARHPEVAGLGTTVTGIARIPRVEQEGWAVFNVGDSRVYRLHRGGLGQVTVDHSEVEEMVSAGILTRAEAREHPDRHVITRALGQHPPPVVDLVWLPMAAGDTFLVASDGLSSELPDDEIRAVLLGVGTPQEKADLLVHLAVEAGGQDNVSVIVVFDRRLPEAGELSVAPEAEPVPSGSRTRPRDLVAREAAR